MAGDDSEARVGGVPAAWASFIFTVGLPGGFATAYDEMNWTFAWRLPMSLKGEGIMGRTT